MDKSEEVEGQEFLHTADGPTGCSCSVTQHYTPTINKITKFSTFHLLFSRPVDYAPLPTHSRALVIMFRPIINLKNVYVIDSSIIQFTLLRNN